jgi:hypothetical protein
MPGEDGGDGGDILRISIYATLWADQHPDAVSSLHF